MRKTFSKARLSIVAIAALLSAQLAASTVNADPAIGVAVVAPITPVTVGVGAVVAVVANEAFAKKPFGPNGEGMKIIKAPAALVKHWFPHW